MPFNLSPTQLILDRSIEAALRRVAVDQGYSLSRATYDLTTEAGQNLYNADIKAIQTNKGFAVEIFGHSNQQYKANKQVARITIDPYGFMPGDIGNDPSPYHVSNGSGGFTKVNAISKFSDYEVNIYISCNTAEQVRTLTALVSHALGKRGYLPKWPLTVKQVSGNFFYEQMDIYDDSDIAEGVIEKVFRYRLPEVFEIAEEEDDVVIAAINQIDLDLVVNQLIAGTTIITNDSFDTIIDNGDPYDLIFIDNEE